MQAAATSTPIFNNTDQQLPANRHNKKPERVLTAIENRNVVSAAEQNERISDEQQRVDSLELSDPGETSFVVKVCAKFGSDLLPLEQQNASHQQQQPKTVENQVEKKTQEDNSRRFAVIKIQSQSSVKLASKRDRLMDLCEKASLGKEHHRKQHDTDRLLHSVIKPLESNQAILNGNRLITLLKDKNETCKIKKIKS
jgi:hypothetical protein